MISVTAEPASFASEMLGYFIFFFIPLLLRQIEAPPAAQTVGLLYAGWCIARSGRNGGLEKEPKIPAAPL